MNLLEIIKNPASFLFRDEKRETRNEISLPIQDTNTNKTSPISFNLISDWKGFTDAVKTADFHWILRGKTGILIKFVLPIVILIFLVQNFYMQKPVTSIVTPPKIEDLGDNLQKPAFINQNYIFATQNEEKFYLYSPNSNKAVTFGVRGISLEEMATPEIANGGFIRISEDSYFYIKQVTQNDSYSYGLFFYKLEKVKNTLTGKIEEKITDKIVNDVLIDGNMNYIFSKAVDGNLIVSADSDLLFLYVINENGDLIFSKKDFEIGSKFFTYYKGEIYFVRSKDGENYIVRLNSNLQEIFSQKLLQENVASFFVVNSDRFLIAYEKPSETSFYEVEMRDGNGKIIFKFIPQESENKLTSLKNIYFEPKNNNVFLFGGGIAKLFTVKGKELWIN